MFAKFPRKLFSADTSVSPKHPTLWQDATAKIVINQLLRIKLERILIDKIFATEFYYIRNDYEDVSKHLYDISILFKNEIINKFLNNEDELKTIISYKRLEERNRKGGIDENLKIKDFSYFKQEFNKDLLKAFDKMQKIYVFDDEYKLSIDDVKKTLNELYKYFQNLD